MTWRGVAWPSVLLPEGKVMTNRDPFLPRLRAYVTLAEQYVFYLHQHGAFVASQADENH